LSQLTPCRFAAVPLRKGDNNLPLAKGESRRALREPDRAKPQRRRQGVNLIQTHGSKLENAALSVLIACSSRTPREPLTSTTSPFLTGRARRSRACTASRMYFSFERSIPASRAPSRMFLAFP